MIGFLERQPLLITVLLIAGSAMMLPALHAKVLELHFEARAFFYSGLMTYLLALFMGIARAGRGRSDHPRRHLIGMLAIFVALPLLLAVPFYEAVDDTTFFNAYVEMVSSLTTTGASLYEPARLAGPIHLWRATVGWMGGLIMLVGAIAVLAPLALGGFEVRARRPSMQDVGAGFVQIQKVADLSYRLRIYGAQILPIYTGLTVLLWIGQLLVGLSPLNALIHAMSTMSTSGISPVGGLQGGASGYGAEVMIAVFLLFSVSRAMIGGEGQGRGLAPLMADPEIRLGGVICLVVPLFLFLRHFLGAYEVENQMDLLSGIGALWGSFFTVLSFLTTTGFVSDAWTASQSWSGLSSTGLILMGLAMIGGGVATTAGGAKLLRVYALYKHGVRELDKLVYPHSVGGSGGEARHLRRQGAYMAWVFFMLMTLSVAIVMVAFSFTGASFEESLILTVSALTTTGPLAEVAGEAPIRYGELSIAAKVILTAAMVLGRLETLAIVALLTPDTFRLR